MTGVQVSAANQGVRCKKFGVSKCDRLSMILFNGLFMDKGDDNLYIDPLPRDICSKQMYAGRSRGIGKMGKDCRRQVHPVNTFSCMTRRRDSLREPS